MQARQAGGGSRCGPVPFGRKTLGRQTFGLHGVCSFSTDRAIWPASVHVSAKCQSARCVSAERRGAMAVDNVSMCKRIKKQMASSSSLKRLVR